VAAILFYLARRFPDAGLLPEGAEAQAHALSWMSFAATTLHPARRQGMDHAIHAWAAAEARMAGQGWVLGRYSVADIHLFRLLWRFNASLQPERDAFPRLAAHHDRMLARPAVRRTIDVEAAIGYECPPDRCSKSGRSARGWPIPCRITSPAGQGDQHPAEGDPSRPSPPRSRRDPTPVTG